MKMLKRTALFCAILLTVPAIVPAQHQANYRYLQIEDLSEEARRCGLQKVVIAPIVAKELRRIGIHIVTVPTKRYVNLSTAAVVIENSSLYCVVAWTLDIKAVGFSSQGKGPVDDLLTHSTVLCRAELVGLYHRNNVQADIAEAMRTLTVQCSRRVDI
jgi:hypothetical protein